jgi:YD repeat-containing protein
MRFAKVKNIISCAIFSALFLIAISAALQAANGSVVYTYDALGRITTASYDTGAFVIYTYDANGNRTAQTTNINTATLTWCLTGGSCGANTKWGQALWH